MTEEKFTIEMVDDSKDVIRNYMGYIKDENGKAVVSINMYYDELEGGNEDFNEDDEDFEDDESGPFVTFYFYEESSELYKLNKEFFDQYFENIGADLIEEESDEKNLVFGYSVNVSPTIESLKTITKELTTAMKEANLKFPLFMENN